MKKENTLCCDVLDKMDLKWMYLANGVKLMPYIENKSGTIKYRVNHCPSCGAYIRDIELKP